MQFQEIVDDLQNIVYSRIRKENSINNNNINTNNEQDFIKTSKPTWSWTINSLITMLKQHPDGVTYSIVKSELLKNWEIYDTDIRNKDKSNKTTSNNDNSKDKNHSIQNYFRKDDIPYDMVIESNIYEINSLKNSNNININFNHIHMNNNDNTKTTTKIDSNNSEELDSLIFDFDDTVSQNNITKDTDISPLLQVMIGDHKSHIRHILHCRFNQFLHDSYFKSKNHTILKQERSIRMTSILVIFSLSIYLLKEHQQEEEQQKQHKRQKHDIDVNNNNIQNQEKETTQQNRINKFKQIILPTENFIFILNDKNDDSEHQWKSIINNHPYYIPIGQIINQLNSSSQKDENGNIITQITDNDRITMMEVVSIDEQPLKVVNQTKWCNVIPHDAYFDFNMRQSIYLLDRESNITIKLVFWDQHCKTIKLINIGETFVIFGRLLYNRNESNFSQQNQQHVFEVTNDTTFCIIPKANNDSGCNGTSSNSSTSSFFNNLIDDTKHEIKDMSNYSSRLMINDIQMGMTGISILARILFIGKMKTESGITKLPIVISDTPVSNIVLVLIGTDMTNFTNFLRIGLLCYFQNLFTIPTEQKMKLYASLENNSTILPISTLTGLINSKFLYKSIQSLSDQIRYDHTVVKIRINELVLYDPLPLFAFHSFCKRLLNFNSQFECAHCSCIVDPSNMEKIFHLSYKISSLNDKYTIVAAPSIPTLNRYILGIDEIEFEKLDVEQRKRILGSVIDKCFLMSISTMKDKNNYSFRIEGCISLNSDEL